MNKMNSLRALLLAALVSVPAMAVAPSGPAPAFKLDSMAGKPVSLDQFKGQVVMINFWATWCGPCRTEMPILEKLHAKYKPMGFTMIGVNVEPDSSLAAKWLQTTPVTFPILFDTKSEVSKLYSVAGHAQHGHHRPQGQPAVAASRLQARRRKRIPEPDPRPGARIGPDRCASG